MRLQSQLTLSHFAVTAISALLIVLGSLIGYAYYLRSDFPAAWAADNALIFAEEIAYTYGDDGTLDSAELAPYFNNNFWRITDEDDLPKLSEWLLITTVEGQLIGSNYDGYSIGSDIFANMPPGLAQADFDPSLYDFLDAEFPVYASAIYFNRDNTHIGFAPVVREDGLHLGWAYYHGGEEDIGLQQRNWATQAAQAGGVLILVALFGSGLMGLWMARRFGRRLAALESASAAFASGQHHQRVAVTGEDEIGRLGKQFNAMADQIDGQIGELRQLADDNAQLAVEAEGFARLEERNRLARDLHDAVKQQLFGMNLTLGSVDALLDSKPTIARERIASVLSQTQAIQLELDQIINQLRPVSLTENGLTAALAQLVADWSAQTGVLATVHAHADRPLPVALEQALYRIVQESLQNIGKHASASEVTVTLTYQLTEVLLTVADDGVGFVVDSAENGHGLDNMRQRAAQHGGTASIESQPNRGTIVTVRMPISAEIGV